MGVEEYGYRFVEGLREEVVRKQIQSPTFFKGFCQEWIEGYVRGVKEKYPHLLETLLKNPYVSKLKLF